jgi:lipoate-protein ligase A
MQRLELTLPTLAENIALDEALLEWAEAENEAWEFLRVWESPRPAVVVGRSSRVLQEVDVAACRDHGIPIIRRTSGGAAIVTGPGCLMYAVVLSYRLRPDLKDIGRAHRFVLGRFAAVLQGALGETALVHCNGTSDLLFDASTSAGSSVARACVGGERTPRKFSGNSMRARRTHLLYHGTLLYGFELSLIETCLRMPPRQPAYREGRSHGEFVANLPVAREELVAAIDSAWPTDGQLSDWPSERVASLVEKQFGLESWNFEFR